MEHCKRSAEGGGARKGAEKELPGESEANPESDFTDVYAGDLNKNCFLTMWEWENNSLTEVEGGENRR